MKLMDNEKLSKEKFLILPREEVRRLVHRKNKTHTGIFEETLINRDNHFSKLHQEGD
jgi:hypothetical protein